MGGGLFGAVWGCLGGVWGVWGVFGGVWGGGVWGRVFGGGGGGVWGRAMGGEGWEGGEFFVLVFWRQKETNRSFAEMNTCYCPVLVFKAINANTLCIFVQGT